MCTRTVDPTVPATVYKVTTHIYIGKKLRPRPLITSAHWTLKSAQDYLRGAKKRLIRMHKWTVQEVHTLDDCSMVMARDKRSKEPILAVSVLDQLDILPHGKKHNGVRGHQEFDHWDEDGSESEESDSETSSAEDDDSEDQSDEEQRSSSSSSLHEEDIVVSSSDEGDPGTESSGTSGADSSDSDPASGDNGVADGQSAGPSRTGTRNDKHRRRQRSDSEDGGRVASKRRRLGGKQTETAM